MLRRLGVMVVGLFWSVNAYAGAHTLPSDLEAAEFPSSGYAANIPGEGKMHAWGHTVPTAGTANYAPGCVFIHTDGSTDTDVLYVNTGSDSSCDFQPVVSDLDSTAGAGYVGILDSGSYYTPTTVEGALQAIAHSWTLESLPIDVSSGRLLSTTSLATHTDSFLMSDTTPSLLYSSDQMFVKWDASDTGTVIYTISLPSYINTNQTISVEADIVQSSASATVMSMRYCVNTGTAATVTDNLDTAALTTYSWTIPAAALTTNPRFVTVYLKPSAHTNSIKLHGLRLKYVKLPQSS